MPKNKNNFITGSRRLSEKTREHGQLDMVVILSYKRQKVKKNLIKKRHLILRKQRWQNRIKMRRGFHCESRRENACGQTIIITIIIKKGSCCEVKSG